MSELKYFPDLTSDKIFSIFRPKALSNYSSMPPASENESFQPNYDSDEITISEFKLETEEIDRYLKSIDFVQEYSHHLKTRQSGFQMVI
jgi:hypothetical protein